MMLKRTYEDPKIHERWESIYRGNPTLDRLNDQIMDRILSYLNPPPNALFLDAGCGTGDHVLRIVRRGFRCIGVDISMHVLDIAEKNVLRPSLKPRVSFACQALQELAFPDCVFDAIHCRGVLMHIPEWEKVLYNLCRALKRGGMIAIMESNVRSLQTAARLLIRRVRPKGSEMRRTEAGVELWSERNGNPFLVRIADIEYLIAKLRAFGVTPVARFTTSVLGVEFFPRGLSRNIVARLNQICFLMRFPPSLGNGNAVVGEKCTT